MSLPKIVSIDNVKAAIGVYGPGSDDLAVLCTHENINKWSRRKPIRHSLRSELDDEHYAIENFGFDLRFNETEGELLSSPDPAYLLGNRDWPYLKPRIDIDPMRLHDFSFYNNMAIPPFDIQVTSSNGTEQNNTGILNYLIYQNDSDPNCEIKVQDLGLFQDTCTWAVIWRIQGETTVHLKELAFTEPYQPEIARVITESADFRIEVPTTYSTMTVEACALINKSNYEYFLVPNSYRTALVKTVTNKELLKMFGWAGASYIQGSMYLYASFDLVNEKAEDRTFTYRAFFKIFKSENDQTPAEFDFGSHDTLNPDNVFTISSLGSFTKHIGDDERDGQTVIRYEDLVTAAMVKFRVEIVVQGQSGQTIVLPNPNSWYDAEVII